MKIKPYREGFGPDVVELGSKGAKHFHVWNHFSFLPKRALKKAVLKGEGVVDGFLSWEPSVHIKGYKALLDPHTFQLSYLPGGQVKIGCMTLSRGQVARAKKWLFGKKEGK